MGEGQWGDGKASLAVRESTRVTGERMLAKGTCGVMRV